jgi:predicted RNA-binding protein YlxR (DUF448 family)
MNVDIARFITYVFNGRNFTAHEQMYDNEYSIVSRKMVNLNTFNTLILTTLTDNQEIIQLLNEINNFIANPSGKLKLVEKYDKIITILRNTRSNTFIPYVQLARNIMGEITTIYNENHATMRRVTSTIKQVIQSATVNKARKFINSTKSLRRIMGGENNKINFIINNKNYIRKVYIEGNKQYIIMQKNKVYINKNNTIKIAGTIYNFQ